MPAPTSKNSSAQTSPQLQRLRAAARADFADRREREDTRPEVLDAAAAIAEPVDTGIPAAMADLAEELARIPPKRSPTRRASAPLLALVEKIDSAEPRVSDVKIALSARRFERGSDVEFAAALRRDFENVYGEIIVDGDKFWRFDGRIWQKIDNDFILRHASSYDGTAIIGGKDEDEFEVSKNKINSAIEIWRRAAASRTREKYKIGEKNSFFNDAPSGINCKSFFLAFHRDGIVVEPHAREHRQRHILDFDALMTPDGRIDRAALRERFKGSLLERFIATAFPGEPHGRKKWWVVFETAASGFVGFGKALEFRNLVLVGPTAGNGKSQAIRMFYELVPEEARSSIEPQNWTEMSSRVKLEHKLFNCVYDMSATPIAGGIFKTVTAGEPFEARDLYESARDVRCSAVHIFGTNLMPKFAGDAGTDTGVARRLAVVPWPSFHARPIPDLGLRIAREEGDILVTLIAEAIRRFIKRGFRFVKPAFLKTSSAEWRNGSDPILMFLEEHTNHKEKPEGEWTLLTWAYRNFAVFCKSNGYAQMNRGTFVERLKQSGIVARRRAEGMCFPFSISGVDVPIER